MALGKNVLLFPLAVLCCALLIAILGGSTSNRLFLCYWRRAESLKQFFLHIRVSHDSAHSVGMRSRVQKYITESILAAHLLWISFMMQSHYNSSNTWRIQRETYLKLSNRKSWLFLVNNGDRNHVISQSRCFELRFLYTASQPDVTHRLNEIGWLRIFLNRTSMCCFQTINVTSWKIKHCYRMLIQRIRCSVCHAPLQKVLSLSWCRTGSNKTRKAGTDSIQ